MRVPASIASFALFVFVLVFGSAEAQSFHRFYGGARVDLDVDRHRLAVHEVGELRDAAAWVARLGETVTVTPTALPEWRLLSFALPASSRAELGARLERALLADDVAFASPVFSGLDGGWATITPGVLVRWKRASHATADAWPARTPEATVVRRRFGDLDGALELRAQSRNGLDVLAFANRLAADPTVAWAEPDWLFSGGGGLVPNDPGVPLLWGMINTGVSGGVADMDMDADRAWDITIGTPTVRVLVIDTGVQPTHPDLNVDPGVDVTNQPGIAGAPGNRCDNHGTPVAGCVSARINNNLGTVGIAPNCRSVSARTFISLLSCNGGWNSQASWTVNALAWGQRNGIRITNNSNAYGFVSSAIDAQYASTRAAGMIHFGVAGNSSQNRVVYPASLPSVNAVSALDRRGNLASFSSFGTGVAYSAPGVQIYMTDRTGSAGWSPSDYTLSSGTSFATPYTAGIAALILSRNPTQTARQVELALRAARDLGPAGWDPQDGWGFVNANAALRTVPYGVGLAGTGGLTPELFAVGTMRIGSSIAVHVEQARASATALIVLGFGRASIPFLGGTLLVAPPLVPWPIGLSATGSGRLPLALPNAAGLIGTKIRFQSGVNDPVAVAGVALTNAVEIEISD